MLATAMNGNIAKPKTYSTIRLAMVTSLVCGLEFCASVALSYVPSMLLKAGLLEQQMTLIMGLGPFFGFFFCPIIGRLSDNCHSRFGRRKPFIFTLSVFIILSLSLIYYSQTLLFNELPPNKNDIQQKYSFLSIFLLVFACVLLDFASQASFNPIESLLLDMCQGTDREHTCFTIYSFMNSLGGCFGYLITGISWNAVYSLIFQSKIAATNYSENDETARERDLYQERSVFTILGVLYAVFACNTLFFARDNVKSLHDDEENILLSLEMNKSDDYIDKSAFPYVYKYNNTVSESRKYGSFKMLIRKFSCVSILLKFGFFIRLFKMPDSLRRLALADCSSWTAIMCFTLFYMDYVGQIVYEGNPSSPSGTIERVLYDEGIRAASWGLFYHCIVAMLYACVINKIIAKLGLVNTFALSMFSFTLSMFLMVLSNDIIVVNIMGSFTGIALASVTTIPYALVTLYHSNKKMYYCDLANFGIERGVGGDMAMLDSAYFLSQIILSISISYVVHITGSVRCYIYTAGILSIIAIYLIKRIKME